MVSTTLLEIAFDDGRRSMAAASGNRAVAPGPRSRLPRSIRTSQPFVQAKCTARRDRWEVRLFGAIAGDHGAPGRWNPLGTRRARHDVNQNAVISHHVDVEADWGLREIGFEPDGSTDVGASQRPGLVAMPIAAYESHRELSERSALEGLEPRDLILG